MIYLFPIMTADHEFNDLDFVGRYSDSMIAKTGDLDWGVVYEYDDDYFDSDPDPSIPPRAVLLRKEGIWVRNLVRSSFVEGKWMMDFIGDDQEG